MPSRPVPGQIPQMLSALGGPPGPCLVGSGLVQPPLRILGARQGLEWRPFFSVPLSSTAPLQAWVGAPTPPTLEGPVRPVPLTSTKLGGPKSWKLRKPQVLRAPPLLGGSKGQIPS